MARNTILATALLSLSSIALAELKNCGASQYDPTQYVCHDNNFLCPVIAGEPLSFCAGACYSTFMYQCVGNTLSELPQVAQGTPFTLTASNPTLPIDGKSITACGQLWSIDGETCSYCPTDVVGSACPAGNDTVIAANDGTAAMDTIVPGGQLVYLGPDWKVHYTQAHSAYIPSGSLVQGLKAYHGGGFVNLNGNGYGWAACPPTASGGGGENGWNLVAKNSTNAGNLGNCFGVNLKVNELPAGTVGAWQYT